MPLLRKGVILPAKGVNFAVPSTFVGDGYAFAENMRYDKGLLRKRPGKTQFGSQTPDSDQITGYGVLELSSGTKHLLRASKRVIQRWNTSTSTWETISIITYNSNDDDYFDFANVTEDNIIVSSNYKNVMYQWNGSGNQTLLGGSPPKAKYLAYVTPYLLAGYTDDGASVEPWRVAWCDTNDPENWSTGNSGEALITDEPSIIQNISKLNDFVAVYKRDSLAIGIKEATDIFRFQTVKTGIGLASPRGFADVEGQQYFIGSNDFYRWNGIRVEPIGAAVREQVFGAIHKTNIHRCFAIHVQEQTEVWFFILTASDDWPTQVWKFNYRYGFWYQDTCSNITAGTRWRNVSSIQWNDLVDSWDQQQVSWDGYSTGASAEQIVLGKSNGLSMYVDYTTTNDIGSLVTGYFISKDFVADQHEFGARWLKLDIWVRGPGDLYVDYSTDFGSSWTNIPYTSSASYIELGGTMTKYEIYFDVWANNIRFRLRNAGDNETFYIQQFTPYYLNREEVARYRA